MTARARLDVHAVKDASGLAAMPLRPQPDLDGDGFATQDQPPRLLDVKPGITGPMQVFGRGQLTFEERLAVEREYIDDFSFSRDLLLLALTLGVVAGRHGAY